MELIFLGTRGGITASKRGHRMHTATMVVAAAPSGSTRVLVDCGLTWLGRLARLAPDAIVLTHAHLDHAGGLARGAPCDVWASADTWERIRRVPVPEARRRVLEPRREARIGALVIEPFPVVHSDLAPAIGLRITDGRARIFYVPDVLRIVHRAEALRGIDAYVGDGASVVRAIVRTSRRTGQPIGHASIADQLDWCRDEGVGRMIVTHCGTQIVAHDERTVGARLRRMAAERGVELEIARDGIHRHVIRGGPVDRRRESRDSGPGPR